MGTELNNHITELYNDPDSQAQQQPAEPQSPQNQSAEDQSPQDQSPEVQSTEDQSPQVQRQPTETQSPQDQSPEVQSPQVQPAEDQSTEDQSPQAQQQPTEPQPTAPQFPQVLSAEDQSTEDQSPQIQYDIPEMEHMVAILTSGPFDIDYIILFGRLAGGTPFSGVAAYDLLLVTDQTPNYDWRKVKRYLRYHQPVRRRGIMYHNIYVMSRRQSMSQRLPVTHFAHNEGKVVYSRIENPLLPTRGCDFMAVYNAAETYMRTVLPIGMKYAELAKGVYAEGRNNRAAALLTSQAVVLFYRTLYYVYYGEEIETEDIVIMHDRLRTLDGELMLLFDGTHIGPNVLLPILHGLRKRFPFDPALDMVPPVLEACMEAVGRLGEVVQRLCKQRLRIYRDRV